MSLWLKDLGCTLTFFFLLNYFGHTYATVSCNSEDLICTVTPNMYCNKYKGKERLRCETSEPLFFLPTLLGSMVKV